MPESTRSNSLHFSPATPTTTCGNLFRIFKQRKNNIHSTYAQVTPLIRKPIAFPPIIHLSASRKHLGPPSHPVASCGHTLVTSHQPHQHLLAHSAPTNHIRIHHNLVDPPPLTSGTTTHYSRTAAIHPPAKAPPQLHLARQPNAPGKPGGQTTLKFPHPYTSPPRHRSKHLHSIRRRRNGLTLRGFFVTVMAQSVNAS